MNIQQKLILIFFVIALVLLSANILIGKVYKTENTIVPPPPLNSEQIDSLFHKSIINFGLPVSTVTNRKIKEVKIDNNYPSYSLRLPKDLPIPVFISELNDIFSDYQVDIITDEKKISGRTVLQIKSEEELKLAAEIDYNADLKRESSSVGFLILINDKTNKSVIDNLLRTPEPFGFLFVPSLVMKSFIASNQNSNRQYIILLGDETTDLDFKFEAGYSERRLKSSVRNLLAAFPKAAFFVVDDNSSFYSSKIYPFIEKEFLSRKINLINKTNLNLLSGSVSNSSSQFRDLMSNIDINSAGLVVCAPDDFTNILGDIRSFRKIGFKYFVPSEIVSIQ